MGKCGHSLKPSNRESKEGKQEHGVFIGSFSRKDFKRFRGRPFYVWKDSRLGNKE